MQLSHLTSTLDHENSLLSDKPDARHAPAPCEPGAHLSPALTGAPLRRRSTRDSLRAAGRAGAAVKVAVTAKVEGGRGAPAVSARKSERHAPSTASSTWGQRRGFRVQVTLLLGATPRVQGLGHVTPGGNAERGHVTPHRPPGEGQGTAG